MGVVANSMPNYSASFATYPNLFPTSYVAGNGAQGANPIITTAGTPGYLGFQDNINGLMQAVFSYGGATLFCELMAEMRRPWDFWKGLLAADLLIFCVYLLFGLFVYVSLCVFFSIHSGSCSDRLALSARATKDNTPSTRHSRASTPTAGRRCAMFLTSSVA